MSSSSILPHDAEKGLLSALLPEAANSTATLHDDIQDGTPEYIPLSTQSTLAPPSEDRGVASPPFPAAFKEKADKPAPAKKKQASRWIRLQLWFNTYRKFFTIVMVLNLVGIVLAASGHFPYARKFTGAMVLGNLLFAILMRNELFGRLLYLVINTLFAKVS
jgi:hypothetical protein